MDVQLTDEGIKAALSDRFRVIDTKKASASQIESDLNRLGNEGFGVLHYTKTMIIMTRIVNMDVMADHTASTESWSVPGAEGSA